MDPAWVDSWLSDDQDVSRPCTLELSPDVKLEEWLFEGDNTAWADERYNELFNAPPSDYQLW